MSPLFGRKRLPATSIAAPVTVELRIEPDEGAFNGEDGTPVAVKGVLVSLPDGTPLSLNPHGESTPGVFFFRVAGMPHHTSGADAPGMASLEQVVLRPDPKNQFDPNAIEVLASPGATLAGYVPASLCGAMLPRMIPSASGSAMVGIVTKTFTAKGHRVGAEVIGIPLGTDLSIKGDEPD